jgi:hypothetical protein
MITPACNQPLNKDTKIGTACCYLFGARDSCIFDSSRRIIDDETASDIFNKVRGNSVIQSKK